MEVLRDFPYQICVFIGVTLLPPCLISPLFIFLVSSASLYSRLSVFSSAALALPITDVAFLFLSCLSTDRVSQCVLVCWWRYCHLFQFSFNFSRKLKKEQKEKYERQSCEVISRVCHALHPSPSSSPLLPPSILIRPPLLASLLFITAGVCVSSCESASEYVCMCVSEHKGKPPKVGPMTSDPHLSNSPLETQKEGWKGGAEREQGRRARPAVTSTIQMNESLAKTRSSKKRPPPTTLH